MKVSKYNSEGYHDPTTYEAFMNIEREKKHSWTNSPDPSEAISL